MNKRRCTIIAALLYASLAFIACAQQRAVQPRDDGKKYRRIVTDRDSIVLEMRSVLDEELTRWYPAAIDTECGGYFSDFDRAWKKDGAQNKMIVTQARHIWSASNAAMFYRKQQPPRTLSARDLAHAAAHGAAFLKHTMWDAQYGGFYELVDRRGAPIAANGELIKTAYGNAFAIYGLSAYYAMSGDTSALRQAQDAFRWLEAHSYDARCGGYFQFLARSGRPFTDGYNGTPPKDYNSLIHILECYTALYRAWPDPLLHDRLVSLFHIIRDTVTTPKGYLSLYFNRDWSHARSRSAFEADHVSFGHDVETAYLLLEAAEALGIKNDALTLRIAKKMVDHTLANGMDADNGGVYDGGSYEHGGDRAAIVRKTKEWWAQAEAVNAFLMMSELFPGESRYYEQFCAQWNYCMNYLIDREHGGWYWSGTDVEPDQVRSAKGSVWKGSYHTSRALINCINRLTQ